MQKRKVPSSLSTVQWLAEMCQVCQSGFPCLSADLLLLPTRYSNVAAVDGLILGTHVTVFLRLGFAVSFSAVSCVIWFSS